MNSAAVPFLPEVVGHDDLKDRLRAMLDGGRLAQGILLVGEEGRGKRTLAHALARAILTRGASPADAARTQRLVDGGVHPGLVHVEPFRDERFITVKRVRRLIESCALRVGEGLSRVVVLARLHAVNEESGNALLKFLEEPPAGTIVIATARDRAAVIETIRSRMHVLPAGPLSQAGVEQVLRDGGFATEDRASLAPICGGAPGRAWDLARGDLARNLIEPARALFDPGAAVQVVVEGLTKTARDQGFDAVLAREAVGPPAAVRALAEARAGGGGGEGDEDRRGEPTLEAARAWIRPVVECVAGVAQDLLRARAGAAPRAASLLERVLPQDAPLRRADQACVTAALVAAVACLDNIDHNLTLPLALEALALRLRAPRASAQSSRR